MFRQIWDLLSDSVQAFVADDALSRGASISFYTIISIGPVLFIVIAIAGLAFGEDAARGAIAVQLRDLMGRESADLVQAAVQSAGKSSGILASMVGAITLLITASGVFGEMQSALNIIWKAEPKGTTISRLVRARAASLGLVAALGFLLLVSLVISAILSGFGGYLDTALPFGALILHILNFVISFALISVLFGAIYKVLPDAELSWRDVLVGAVVTALLFNIGKFLIGLYLAHSAMASSYGAARRPDHRAAVDLLFGADFPSRCGVHQGLRKSPRHSSRHPRRRLMLTITTRSRRLAQRQPWDRHRHARHETHGGICSSGWAYLRTRLVQAGV